VANNDHGLCGPFKRVLKREGGMKEDGGEYWRMDSAL